MTGKYLEPKSWTAWTNFDVQTLTEMWSGKNSASVIAATLTEKTGRKFTRNSVLGKIHRLGLLRRGQPANGWTKPNKRKPTMPIPPTVARSDPYAIVLSDLQKKRDQVVEAIRLLEPLAPAPTHPTSPRRCNALEDDHLAAAEQAGCDTAGEEVGIPVSNRVTLIDLRSGICRYPIGDPLAADFTFCGDACDVTQSYCDTHHRIAYTPIQKRKQVAWRAHR